MPYLSDPRGSVWRKWDLHIHTPFSYQWNGTSAEGLAGARLDGLLNEMVEAINQAEPAAFCLMDYWTLEGWFALKSYVQRNPGTLKKAVFPGLELRLEAPTDHRLNTHFLFDNELTDQQLREFLNTLAIGIVNRPPSTESFAELGRQYDDGKLGHHGLKPGDRQSEAKMALLGRMTAKITRDSWQKAREKLGDRVILIQPYDTNDGLEDLDWKRHPYDDLELMRAADFFETRDLIHVRLFLGSGHPTKPAVSKDFIQAIGGRPKPVLAGSDAHRFNDYGKYPGGKICWIKADATFEGLRQCMVDPIGRVFIGDVPPKVLHQEQNPTKYIDRIRISKIAGSPFNETWFDCDLPLNPGMVAVIGNKGGGKSALADIIALAGNSHCPTLEFLNERRFRKPGEAKAQHFKASLTWGNGDVVELPLMDNANDQLPERVRYLPQQYIEQLCAEIGQEGRHTFEAELKKVVFSHVPPPKRLGRLTLDEVVNYRTEQIESLVASLRLRLATLNKQIAGLERDVRVESVAAVEGQIGLRERELESLDARKPAEVAKPDSKSEAQRALLEKLASLRTAVEADTTTRQQLVHDETRLAAAAAATERLLQRLENLESEVRRSLGDAEGDAEAAGIQLSTLFRLEVNVQPVEQRREAIASALLDVENRLEATVERITRNETELRATQDLATEPERAYEAYREAYTGWEEQRRNVVGSLEQPGTLVFLRERRSFLAGKAKENLAELRQERGTLMGQVHDQVMNHLSVYRDLYGPIEKEVARHAFLQQQLRVEVNVLVDGLNFPERFVGLLNQGRRGTFYGQDEGFQYAKRLVQEADLTTSTGLAAFLTAVRESLETDKRDGKGGSATIEDQLREGVSREELYDFLFGLSYLRPRLTLQLGGKEIGELSPGERGILLLVFYLLLDRDEIPLVIDQPEHNLDNSSVYKLLQPCIRRAKNLRQIVLVTHNPNVAIVCDAEEVVLAVVEKQANDVRVSYKSGAIENPDLNLSAVNVLEGTWPAFNTRGAAYQRALEGVTAS